MDPLEPVRFVKHGCVCFESDDTVVYVDPYKVPDDAHDADLIVITHSHGDHYSPEDIERVRKEGVDREIFTLCKNEKYGQLIENLENVEDSASQMADFALAGQTVAQQITMLAGLTAEDADAALQHILRPERMAVMHIEPDGTAVEDEEEEETEE